MPSSLTFLLPVPGINYETHRSQSERRRRADEARIARAAAEHGYLPAQGTAQHEHVAEPLRSILNSISGRGARK